jgi:hypothetical protein
MNDRRPIVWAVILAITCAAAVRAQNLIVSTPGATTVQLPTFGVAINADGVVALRSVEDPTGALRLRRLDEAKRRLPGDVQARSPLRKISLVRLERELQKRVAAGSPPDDVLENLAGLQNIRFAFVYPDAGDIVLAGEAEGWLDDGLGRTIGLTTGRPTLALDDLRVALGAFNAFGAGAATFIGCTIDPTPEGLARMDAVRREMPRVIRDAEQTMFAAELNRRTLEALGRAEVRVFGIAADTHLAAVLVEADYRMKRIAVGVERPPVPLPSYVERETGATSSPLLRYWFVPDYDRLQTDAARESLEILGRGVRLQTEDARLAAGGAVQTARNRDAAALSFCADFTKRYEAIAAASPVFAELRNGVDLLVASAFLARHDWYGRAGWKPTLLVNRRTLPLRPAHAPTAADVVVNTVWKGRRMISVAGGGVSIDVGVALNDKHTATIEATRFTEPRQAAVRLPDDGSRWWWD